MVNLEDITTVECSTLLRLIDLVVKAVGVILLNSVSIAWSFFSYLMATTKPAFQPITYAVQNQFSIRKIDKLKHTYMLITYILCKFQ